jgi:hypothetical protein
MRVDEITEHLAEHLRTHVVALEGVPIAIGLPAQGDDDGGALLVGLLSLEPDVRFGRDVGIRADVRQVPELGVVARYLITDTGPDHRRAQRHLHEVLRAVQLAPVLTLDGDPGDRTVRLLTRQFDLDDQTRVWRALRQPLRPALFVEASFVDHHPPTSTSSATR